eukprot:TRINITY_DN2143_c0_g1_i1.p1 TRINITY_DN2143_c0_g1~~TRINITY_DN2143_c0_g1_i1.p1  ORF type:complete len:142 (-),score=25.48 TRINITY_DN2143_c0_g1_i1:39-422(-)
MNSTSTEDFVIISRPNSEQDNIVIVDGKKYPKSKPYAQTGMAFPPYATAGKGEGYGVQKKGDPYVISSYDEIPAIKKDFEYVKAGRDLRRSHSMTALDKQYAYVTKTSGDDSNLSNRGPNPPYVFSY